MGTMRPKRLPRLKAPRAHLVMHTGKVALAPGIEATGTQPRVLVTVRILSRRQHAKFVGWCRRNGCWLTLVQQHGIAHPRSGLAYTETYDAVGTVGSLALLCSHTSVTRWQYVMSATVGERAAGSGERTSRKLAKLWDAPTGQHVTSVTAVDRDQATQAASHKAGTQAGLPVHVPR